MSSVKSAHLKACEARIQRCLGRDWRFGEILCEILDDMLYEATHASFTEYCNDRQGMKGGEALWYVRAVKVRDNLARNGCSPLPEHMHEVSPLIGLSEDEQVAVWRSAQGSG